MTSCVCIASVDAQHWVDSLMEHTTLAIERDARERLLREHGHSTLALARARVKLLVNSRRFQFLTAGFIFVGFLCDIFESQYPLLRDGTSSVALVFYLAEVCLTLVFTVELSLNVFALSNDCCRPFFANSSNLMDLLIVMASLLALTSWFPGLPNTKSFRLLRVGRVIRLIKGAPL